MKPPPFAQLAASERSEYAPCRCWLQLRRTVSRKASANALAHLPAYASRRRRVRSPLIRDGRRGAPPYSLSSISGVRALAWFSCVPLEESVPAPTADLLVANVAIPTDTEITAPGDAAGAFLHTTLQEGGKRVRFEVVIEMPGEQGPFPLLVFNHGSTGKGTEPQLFRNLAEPIDRRLFRGKGLDGRLSAAPRQRQVGWPLR